MDRQTDPNRNVQQGPVCRGVGLREIVGAGEWVLCILKWSGSINETSYGQLDNGTKQAPYLLRHRTRSLLRACHFHIGRTLRN